VEQSPIQEVIQDGPFKQTDLTVSDNAQARPSRISTGVVSTTEEKLPEKLVVEGA
jgi:hypothetical protein